MPGCAGGDGGSDEGGISGSSGDGYSVLVVLVWPWWDQGVSSGGDGIVVDNGVAMVW